MDLTPLQQRLDIFFDDISLLEQALRHRSLVNETDMTMIQTNERLEFLGDAILDFLVADLVYRTFPDVSEGYLTQIRSAMVKTETLAVLARDCDLGNWMIMGKGEENTGGRDRSTILGSAFEALVGAIFLDGGLELVKRFVMPRMQRLLEYTLEHSLHLDARSALQEWSQAENNITPRYHVADFLGTEHDQRYLVQVVIGDEVIAEATGTSKRSAAQASARVALRKLNIEGWIEDEDNFESLDLPNSNASQTNHKNNHPRPFQPPN